MYAPIENKLQPSHQLGGHNQANDRKRSGKHESDELHINNGTITNKIQFDHFDFDQHTVQQNHFIITQDDNQEHYVIIKDSDHKSNSHLEDSQ